MCLELQVITVRVWPIEKVVAWCKLVFLRCLGLIFICFYSLDLLVFIVSVVGGWLAYLVS